jgi:arginase
MGVYGGYIPVFKGNRLTFVNHNQHSMLFINPQWQGSGLTNELEAGARTYQQFFKQNFELIPLSSKSLETQHDIIAYEAILEQAKSFKQALLDHAPDKVSTLGGDCGIEIIPISYLNKRYDGNLKVIWIDAHADLNTPSSSPSKTFHGMPLRTLLGEGEEGIKNEIFSFIKVTQICFVGLRELDEPEEVFIDSNEINSMQDADYELIEALIEPSQKVYIHLDLDVLNQEEFPHTLFPGTGLTVTSVTELIQSLKANHDVVGICITESIAKNLDELQAIESILNEVSI